MARTSSYSSPGVDVIIERSTLEQRSAETEFYPVFIGTGLTSRNRNIQKADIKADTTQFPLVKLEFDMLGEVNTDIFKNFNFTIGQAIVQKASVAEGTDPTITLEPTADYEVAEQLSYNTTDGTAEVTLEILNPNVTPNDMMYTLNFRALLSDKDFDLRAIGMEDRFFSKEMFGPVVLDENDTQFYNDIAIAAEIAFRMEVPRFYYLEVPRDYGEQPTKDEWKQALDKIYFFNDAYRVIPLTSDPEVATYLNQFVSGVSNPVDRRETVGFVTYDVSKITNINDMTELVEKVGGYSNSLNNKRIVNVFSGESAEIVINGETYVLPPHFVAAAVVALDAVVGRVEPLSLREVNVFEKINCPRFRPKQWDLLAEKGVFIVYQDNPTEPAIIRHQLTTAQSREPADQEYSVVKNFDVVVKKMRDRFSVYSGRYNIDAGYAERLDATTATVRQELLEEKLARDIQVVTAWSQRENGDERNLVTRLSLTPVYPANDLDVYLII